eukprot:6205742-Amphidinium_carterae.1
MKDIADLPRIGSSLVVSDAVRLSDSGLKHSSKLPEKAQQPMQSPAVWGWAASCRRFQCKKS